MLLDGSSVHPVEVHGHGTSGSERVATDIRGCVAILRREETQAVHAAFDGSVNVATVDVARLAQTGVVGSDGSVASAPMCVDMGDASREGANGTEIGAGGRIMDALALDSVLLVGDTECRFIGGKERS